MAEPRTVAEEYHRLTKYTQDNIRGGPDLDWARQPGPTKEIVSQRRISLKPYHVLNPPAGSEEPEFSDTASPSGSEYGLPQLARMLFHTNGVTGMLPLPGGRSHPLRAAPSAGALYPTETYVAVRNVAELDPGFYNYQSHTHELVPLWEGDQMDEIQAACFGNAAYNELRACVLLTGLFWRSAWRYQERGYRRVLLDTGHVLGNLCAYAPCENCAAIPILGFLDDALNGLFFFDDAVEAVIGCVPVLEEVTECIPEPLVASPTTKISSFEGMEIPSEPALAESASIALHRVSACLPDGKTHEVPANGRVSDLSFPLAFGGGAENNIPRMIATRRSARRYAEGSIGLGAIGNLLGFAFGRGDELGAGRPARFATREGALLDAHLLAFDIEGLDPGHYAIEGAGEALLSLALGDFREKMFRVALGQEIARACAAVLAFTAPAEKAIRAFGDRVYRYLHIEAGHIGERFQLAAQGQRLGACGIGGFLDDEAADLLQIDRNDFVVYFVTLGRV